MLFGLAIFPFSVYMCYFKHQILLVLLGLIQHTAILALFSDLAKLIDSIQCCAPVLFVWVGSLCFFSMENVVLYE